MIQIIIILAYVANVFLNRWLNKIYIKRGGVYKKVVCLWFIPISTTIAFLFLIFNQSNFKIKENWFTGKNW